MPSLEGALFGNWLFTRHVSPTGFREAIPNPSLSFPSLSGVCILESPTTTIICITLTLSDYTFTIIHQNQKGRNTIERLETCKVGVTRVPASRLGKTPLLYKASWCKQATKDVYAVHQKNRQTSKLSYPPFSDLALWSIHSLIHSFETTFQNGGGKKKLTSPPFTTLVHDQRRT